MSKETKVRVFPTQYSESAEKGTFETFRKPSKTEPDNAMSIPEIIARFTRGYGLQVEAHDWTVGSASEEGESFNDNENFFEEFASSIEAPNQAPNEAPNQAPNEVTNQAPQEATEEPNPQSEG